MKWLGYKQVAVKSINLDAADIRRRMKAAHVAELASDSRETGDEFIHAPTIRDGSKALVCGRDRMAAALMRKRKKIWVHVAQCTDDEARGLERRENIYRRPIENRSQLLAELVEARTKEIQADSANEVGTVSPPAAAAAKVEARKQIARAAGVSVGAIKKAQQRAKAAKVLPSDGADAPVSADGRGEAPSDVAVTLDLLGCDGEGGRAIMELALGDQQAIDDADQLLRQAQAALKRVSLNTLQQQLYADVHRVASRVRSHRPEFICPWCRGLPALLGECTPCQTLGFVSHEIAGRAPRELLDSTKPVVAVHGQFVPYADALAGKLPKNGAPPAKAAKKGGRLAVELPDGRVVDPEVEADEAAY